MRKLLTKVFLILLFIISLKYAISDSEFIKNYTPPLPIITTTTLATTSDSNQQTTTTITTATTTNRNNSYNYRGIIADRNNKIVMSNEGMYRKISEPYNVCLSNVLDGYNSSLAIDSVFENTLRQENPSTIYSETGYPIGQSLILTLDAEIQYNVYEYMSENNLIGSTTVLGAKGDVIALVSYPAYDANADFTELNLEPHSCYNRCVEAARPGSTFKIFSSVIAAEYGFNTYTDPGYLPNFDISNWDTSKAPYPTPIVRTLRQAFRFSSNCYYSDLFFRLGSERVLNVLDKYFNYTSPIECDFITLNQDISLNTNPNLVRAGFGQRNSISPLYLAMTSNAIITGELNLPYIANKTVDTVSWEQIQQLTQPKTLSTIPLNVRNDVIYGMNDIASDLKLTLPNFNLYSKTGTAELGENKNDLHYIVVTISDQDLTLESTKTIVFQYFNSKSSYASGDAKYMQEILNIVQK